MVTRVLRLNPSKIQTLMLATGITEEQSQTNKNVILKYFDFLM